MRRLKWFVVVPVALVVLGFAGSFVYVNFIANEAPAPLTVDNSDLEDGATAQTSTTAAGDGAQASGLDGAWTVADGSQAGYRVEEILFGQATTAVGRTTDVTGSMTLAGEQVTAAEFAVNLANVASDESRRDNQFRGRIMDVANHPQATFSLTQPIALGSLPAEGATVRADATGDLTLRGTTKTVTVPLEAKRSGATIEVAGRYEVVFDEWGIPNPSFGPAEVGEVGQLEFLLVLRRA